jgi:hypothetical protein
MITGTTNLTSGVYIPRTGWATLIGDDGVIQMKSADLGATVTYALEFSLDTEDWDVAVRSGAEVTGTLAKNEIKVLEFDATPGLSFRLNVLTETTGTITYKILE